MVARYRNGWWLQQKYHEEGLTQREIADLCDVSPTTVRDWMKRRGVPRRNLEGENHPLYGERRDEAVREQISETMAGREFTEEWRERISAAQRGEQIPESVRENISESLSGLTRPESTRRKMSESTVGEQNPNWKGGYSRQYGPGWGPARERIRQRDEVCQHCGCDGSERQLHVHHIAPVRLFREADNVDLADAHVDENLVLLCCECHGRADHGQIEFELLPVLEAVFSGPGE
jgi:5-methylcytosine-specific restriction endonuclease McrA